MRIRSSIHNGQTCKKAIWCHVYKRRLNKTEGNGARECSQKLQLHYRRRGDVRLSPTTPCICKFDSQPALCMHKKTSNREGKNDLEERGDAKASAAGRGRGLPAHGRRRRWRRAVRGRKRRSRRRAPENEEAAASLERDREQASRTAGAAGGARRRRRQPV